MLKLINTLCAAFDLKNQIIIQNKNESSEKKYCIISGCEQTNIVMYFINNFFWLVAESIDFNLINFLLRFFF